MRRVVVLMSARRLFSLSITSASLLLALVPPSALRASIHKVHAASGARNSRTVTQSAAPPQRSTHERFATFLAGKDFKSVFVLQNFRQDVSVTVTPGVIVSAGEFSMDPVTLPPHSQVTVDISAFLSAHGYSDDRGTAFMRYTFSPYGPIVGVVLSSDYEHKLYLNSYAQSPEEYWQGNSYDATIWAPDQDTKGFLSLTNTSNETRTVRPTFLVDGRSRELPPIRIPARRTHVLDLGEVVSQSREKGAGIHLEYTEYPGDLLAEGHLYNRRTGFEKYIHFLDKTLHYPSGMMRTQFLLLGQQPAEDGYPADISFRSVAVVRNVDSASVQVIPTVKFMRNGSLQSADLTPIRLGVGESQVIDFSEEQKAGLLPADLRQGSLLLDPHTDHAAIVAELFNFSEQTGGYPIGPFFFAYPTRATGSLWRIDGTFQTTLMIENAADQDDEITLKLFSGQDAYVKKFPVSAGGLLKINLKQLQSNHVPDQQGHPLAATSVSCSSQAVTDT
jgi:hypothetical protein